MPAVFAHHRLATVLAVAALTALLAAVFALTPHPGAQAQTGPANCDSLTVPLATGFNLVGVLNPATPAAVAPGASAVFGWDADAQQYGTWRPDCLPPSIPAPPSTPVRPSGSTSMTAHRPSPCHRAPSRPSRPHGHGLEPRHLDRPQRH